MIIVTLTKLLVIRIVASVRSLSSRNFRMLLSLDDFCAFSSARSDGDRLKKAISEPLANPDIKSRMAAKIAANITSNVGGEYMTLEKTSVMYDKKISSTINNFFKTAMCCLTLPHFLSSSAHLELELDQN